MQCPQCNYFMGDLDVECARCHGKGLQQATAPTAPSPTSVNNTPSPPTNSSLNGLQTSGAILLALGVLCAGYFFLFFDPSVEALGMRINNIGLMAQRQNGILIGLGLMVVGAILFGIGHSQSSSDTHAVVINSQNSPSASSADLTMLYLFSAILPLGGIIFCIVNLDKPERLRSAVIGTVIGSAIWFYLYYRMYLVT